MHISNKFCISFVLILLRASDIDNGGDDAAAAAAAAAAFAAAAAANTAAAAAAAPAVAPAPVAPVISEKDRLAVNKKRYLCFPSCLVPKSSYIIPTTNRALTCPPLPPLRLRNKLNAQTQRDKTKASMEANRKLIEELRAQETELDAAIEDFKRKVAKFE
jgi:hypothetical protein